MDTTLIVGIDCAVDPKNTGLARAILQDGNLRVLELHERVNAADIATRVAGWMTETPLGLIAMDAPLGWPAPLARALHRHRAGEALPEKAHPLFRRQCDEVVASTLKKRPLDVGADRIARTAHAALNLLAKIRSATQTDIPLAWTPGPPSETVALEVYPGGTLKALGMRSSGYKGAGREDERSEICLQLRELMTFDDTLRRQMTRSDHLLDAALCTLAGADFMQREMLLPPDDDDVRKEGWIWVRRPIENNPDDT